MMSAASGLDDLRKTLVARVGGAAPLTEKGDHAEGLGARVLSEALTGSCDGYLGLPKIGWCSATRLDGPQASFLHLSAQVAPNYDVPHLTLDITAPANGPLSLAFDLTAREDVVANKFYVENFYKQAEPWFEKAKSRCTVVPNTAGLGMRALASPVNFNAACDSLDDAAAIADELVSLWSNWLQNPTEINRLKRGTAYARDCSMHKQRWMHYCGVVAGLGEPSPQRAAEIASALAGPGDEVRNNPSSFCHTQHLAGLYRRWRRIRRRRLITLLRS